MADTQALDTLLEQATGARDSALEQHRRALSAADAARRQGEQLSDYRKEYVRRFGTQPGRAGSVELLQCYHGFMARLDDAVSQQVQLAAQAARRMRQLWSRYQKARDLIALGAYAPGHDVELDLAVRHIDGMRGLLQQDMHEPARLADSVRQLRQLTGV